MATFNEQVLLAWDEWEASTGETANNPDDFVAWAMKNRKLEVRPQDLNKLMKRRVTAALRQAIRVDDDGFSYRAKQCVVIAEEGLQLSLWFDTDKGGTPNLRQKAVRQRRDGIAHDVYKAACDVDHMNKTFPNDPQLSFHKDFTDDYAERRAADMLNRDKDEDDEAA
jgi:hypothetical protein